MKKLITLSAVGLMSYALFQRATAGNAYAQSSRTPQQGQGFLNMDWWPSFSIKPANDLRYFSPAEFGQWWPSMSTELLQKLDEFRHRLGVPVSISLPNSGGLGRNMGLLSMSQHNVDVWGEVRAADVIVPHHVSLEDAYLIAVDVGFTGIGAYPHWRPSHGLHLDVRIRPFGVATWSGKIVNGKQTTDNSINEAFT